jgi:SAM-dependent methyltransferase
MLTKEQLLKAVKRELQLLPEKIDLRELTRFGSLEEFVSNAYQSVLNRQPDPFGEDLYLSKLRRGELTREEVVFVLRYSSEGKNAGVKIPGLEKHIVMHKIFQKLRLKKIGAKFQPVVNLFHHQTSTKDTGLSAEEYAEFEKQFRGTEEDVKKKLSIYMPAVSAALEKFETRPVKAVDLGCGRGEWLEMVKAHGVSAKGVEINDFFLKRLEHKNIDAVKADVFEFLKKTADNTYHIVTAFHLIEHIDVTRRVQFLREILRVLQNGGLCILETPNPRNLFVGSGDFYRDPSHSVPLFPDTLAFLGKALGFSGATSFFLKEQELVKVDQYAFDRLEDYISVSRDFAWMGEKN